MTGMVDAGAPDMRAAEMRAADVTAAWQLSLTGDDAPRPAAAVPVRRGLTGGAWIEHAPGWLAGADRVMAELVDRAPWKQRQRPMYDRQVVEPRLTAWWSLNPDGGASRPSEGAGLECLPPVLLESAGLLAGRYGVDLDSIGANLYRDGRDSVAWHGDTIRHSLAEAVVAIVSLGQPRPLLLRPTGGGRSLRFVLGGGDLFVMGGTAQRTWQHSVPKTRSAGARISVTYRHSR
jgi:alkylated DNA repair dioxygenase AlkB